MKIAYGRPRDAWTALLIFSSSLLLFYVLYRIRSLDDSRLSSWEDVFSVVRPLRTGVLLCCSLIAALFFSRISLIETYPKAALFSFSFVVSALFRSEPEMIVDASRYFTQAKHLELYGVGYFFREWGNGINAWTDLPAIPFLYGMLFKFFGESRPVIQIFNALLYSFTVVLTYLTGKELWDRDRGFYGALFLLAIPYLYTQVPLMMVDLPSMFFLMLSVCTFLLALRRGGVMAAVAGLSISISFFTKYSTWLMLSVIPLIYAVELYGNRKKDLAGSALRGMIVFFISSFLISVMAALKHDVIVMQIHLLLSYQKPGLTRWGESLASTYLFQVHPLIPVLAAVSLFAAFRKRDLTFVIAAWLVLVVLVLQIRRIRYIIMVFPMLCLMASYGLGAIRDKMTGRSIACSMAAFSVTLAVSGFMPFLQQTSAVNLRDAAAYLNSLDVDVIEVFTPLPGEYVMNPSVSLPLLDLHLKKKIVYRYDHTAYPLPEDIERSPLRFTWTYRNPLYYQTGAEGYEKRAVLIITDSPERALPDPVREKVAHLPEKRTFGVSDNIFRQQTLATVHH